MLSSRKKKKKGLCQPEQASPFASFKHQAWEDRAVILLLL